MNFQIALLALVAVSPGATAAQIAASPSIALRDPARTIGTTILDQLAGPGVSAYDYLVIATPGPVISRPDTPAKIPAVALVGPAAIAISFFIIVAWQRWAIRPNHRVFSRRRKRTLRRMAHI